MSDEPKLEIVTPEPEESESPEVKMEKICANCKHHFPPDNPLIIAAPPQVNGVIQQPNQRVQVPMIKATVCGNYDSPKFQSIVTIGATCENFEPAKQPEVAPAPKKMQKRMIQGVKL